MSQATSKAERSRREPDDTVARVLDDLFRTHRHPEGREWMHKEVADAINTTHQHLLRGSRVDPSHISKMRSGEIRDPGRRTLLAICAFFQVSPTIFFPELEAPSPDPATQAKEQLRVALRATGLPPNLLSHIEGLIRDLQPPRAVQVPNEGHPDSAHAEPSNAASPESAP